ncbi:protein FRG2-like-1 [Erinaceus europaeus]|uniref:Protein FRG2-like-1 n=1 Tax=Erinaceus europaeus TaxID=9365 RepID=A0ABM3WM81_ERIEU|nr:protein FRG2-like-1 [Erinaceus europaeus]
MWRRKQRMKKCKTISSPSVDYQVETGKWSVCMEIARKGLNPRQRRRILQKRNRKAQTAWPGCQIQKATVMKSPPKWRNRSWDCIPKGTGTSPAEGHNEHYSKIRKRKTPDGGHESHKYPRWRPCTPKRRLTGHRQRSQSLRPTASQPPPLRKSLVSSLSFMSEATYERLTQLPQEAQYMLAQLQAPLWTLMHSCYAMASQAA